MLKKILIGTAALVLGLVGTGYWLTSLLDTDGTTGLEATTPADLAYLQRAVQENRGKILAVVTSTGTMGDSGKRTGYELTELSRAYYVFSANGYEVDIASPRGGKPPVVIDDEDMGDFDYAFLNDKVAQHKVSNTIPTADINPADYEAVYFVGGKGAMWDFPDDPHIQNLVLALHTRGKVVAAVCHGPAALVNVRLDNGEFMVASREISGFTNDEELFLIPDAREVFPFLLEDRLRSRGALFRAGGSYLEQVSTDDKLITGQNPWSVWSVADAIVQQLGFQPIPRTVTADEHSVEILASYDQAGFQRAQAHLQFLVTTNEVRINRNLIAMHALIAAMRWDLVKAFDLVRIVSATKRAQDTA